MDEARANQVFVVETTTRAQIARCLNEFLDAAGWTALPPGPLEPDDARLTDEICQAFCDALSQLDPSSDPEDESEDVYLIGVHERCLLVAGVIPYLRDEG